MCGALVQLAVAATSSSCRYVFSSWRSELWSVSPYTAMTDGESQDNSTTAFSCSQPILAYRLTRIVSHAILHFESGMKIGIPPRFSLQNSMDVNAYKRHDLCAMSDLVVLRGDTK
jgi:hypothetical protein